jgi:hypothetical protein
MVILSLAALAARSWWSNSEVPRPVANDGLVPGAATGNLTGGPNIELRTGLVENTRYDRADSPCDGLAHPQSG